MSVSMHNPDKIKLSAGSGISISGTYPNLTISAIPSYEIVFSQTIRVEDIFSVCGDFGPSAVIECEYFNNDSVVQLTLVQDPEQSVCNYFYLTGRFVYNDLSGHYDLFIYLWGDMKWERYDIFVTVTNYISCRESNDD